MPGLLAFPGKSGKINIPERISTKYKTFGTLLLQDEFGEKVGAIAEEMKPDVTNINIIILERWLRGEGLKPCSWRKLVQILRESGLTTLANDVELVKSPV